MKLLKVVEFFTIKPDQVLTVLITFSFCQIYTGARGPIQKLTRLFSLSFASGVQQISVRCTWKKMCRNQQNALEKKATSNTAAGQHCCSGRAERFFGCGWRKTPLNRGVCLSTRAGRQRELAQRQAIGWHRCSYRAVVWYHRETDWD